MDQLKPSKDWTFANWAGTYTCRPELYFEPKEKSELGQILKLAKSNKKQVKIVGRGHSPSSIACSKDYMVSLRYFNKLVDIDLNKMQVKVEGGMTISEINEILGKNDLALSVQGSVSDVTIAGAISTGTHGTGEKFGILSTYAVEIEMMLASGEIKTYSESSNPNEFGAVRCSLGCLGIILAVTIQCEKAFKLEQIEYGARLEDVLGSLDTHIKSSDHFRMMWFPHTDSAIVYSLTRTDKDISKSNSNWFTDMFVGYYLLEFLYWLATFFTFMVPFINRIYFKLQSSRKQSVNFGYNLFTFNCLFKQYVYESAIPRQETAYFLLKLRSYLDNNPNLKVHFPVEIRFAQKDDIWLSPCYQTDTCYINIIAYRPYGKEYPREEWWNVFDSLTKECHGKPHWAKTHTFTKNELETIYPKFSDFVKLREKLDPTNIFMNDYLTQIFN